MKVLKNKKMMTGLITSLVGLTILLTGLTLAWFTSSGSVFNKTIKAGSFEVIATLSPTEFGLTYPGDDLRDNIGTVRKTGNLPALAKLEFVIEAVIKSDDNGKPLPQSEWYTVKNPDDIYVVVQEDGAKKTHYIPGYGTVVEVLAHKLGDWVRPDFSRWYHWGKGPDGNYYVVIDGDDTLRFAYTLESDGAKIGNKYQNAAIDVKLDWLATQLMPDEAIEDVLGLGYTDIDWFDYYLELPFPVPFSFGGSTYADSLAKRIDSLPESAYRTFLEGRLASIQ